LPLLPGSNTLQLELPVRIQYLPGMYAGKFLGDVV
jgi:hypothetical protein